MPVMRNGGLYTSEPRAPLVSWVLGAPMSEPPQAASTNAAPKPNPPNNRRISQSPSIGCLSTTVVNWRRCYGERLFFYRWISIDT